MKWPRHMTKRRGGLYTAFIASVLCLVVAACDRSGEDVPAPESTAAAPSESASSEAAPETDAGSENDAAPPSTAQGEREEARPWLSGDELEELRNRLGLGTPAALPVRELLTPVDVRELASYTGTLQEVSLVGQEPTTHRNSLRMASDDGFGVGLQVWRVDEVRQLEPRFERLRQTYIHAERPERIIGQQAFMGEFGGLRHYAFLHRASRQLVVVTCGMEVCDSADKVSRIAGRVHSRL